MEVAKILRAHEIYGVDIDAKLVEEARRRGINTYIADLNTDRLPFTSEEFDVVSAFEVIQYL